MTGTTIMDAHLVESFPRVAIADLREAGVLAAKAGDGFALDLGGGDSGQPRWSLRVHVHGDPDCLMIESQHGPIALRQRVFLATRLVGRAMHHLFVCSRSGEGVRALYLVNGELISRAAADLGYASRVLPEVWRQRRVSVVARELRGTTNGPARGANRRRLLEELAELDRGGYASEAERRVLQEQRLRDVRIEARRRRRTVGQDGLPAGVYQRGQNRLQIGYFSPALEGPVILDRAPGLILDHQQRTQNTPSPAPLPPSFGKDVLEDTPALDIRDLIARGHLVAGRVAAFRIVGKDLDGAEMEGVGAVDCRDLGASYLVVRLFGSALLGVSEDFAQVVNLAPSDGSGRMRWRFTNSEHERLFDVLYWRGGRFGDATSQNLTYRSQIRPHCKTPASP